MNSWCDITRFDGDAGCWNLEDLARNSQAVSAAVEQEAQLLGGNLGRVFLGGLSQGCALALHAGLGFGGRLAGVVGLSGYLLPGTPLPAETSPTLLVHGDRDQLLPLQSALDCYRRDGFDQRPKVELHQLSELPHTIDDRVTDLVRKFLRKVVEQAQA